MSRIRPRAEKGSPWLGVLLIPPLLFSCGREESGPLSAAIPVQVQAVQSAQVEDSSEFVGTLEAQERVILRPEIGGRVIEIVRSEGDEVVPGDRVIQLRPNRNEADVQAAEASAEAQRAALQSTEAEVRSAEAEVARLQADVSRQEAQLLSSEADLELAQINYQRAEELVTAGVQAQQVLDDRQRDLNAAQSGVEATRQALESAKMAMTVAEGRLESAQAGVNASEATLAQAEATVTLRTEDLDFNTVAAPIGGIVGNIPVKVGDVVNAGQELTSIIQNDPLEVSIAVPVNRLSQLQLGIPVELLETGQDEPTATGEISFVSPQVDRTVQAVIAKATFPNPTGILRDGQFSRVRVIWDQEPGVLIPSVAISRIAGQPFAFVVEQAGTQATVQQVPIQLGRIQGQSYAVLEGLQAGEQIAVTNILKLKDGVAVQPVNPDPS